MARHMERAENTARLLNAQHHSSMLPNAEDSAHRQWKSILDLFELDQFAIDEKKLLNSIRSTNFTNLKNKEQNEGFEESVISSNGEKKPFFNLGFNNRWQKILPKNILNQLNKNLQKELNDLGYNSNE